MRKHSLIDLFGRTLILVAHPDDECIAAGTLLQRIHEPHVIYATDGAPRDQYFWGRYGSRENYHQLRRKECQRALAHVGVADFEFISDDPGCAELFVDQCLFKALPQAAEQISQRIERLQPEAIFTLAYEGGHPDHDSCSLLASVLGREYDIPVWEAPLYHRAPEGEDDPRPLRQEFLHLSETEIHLSPSQVQREHKAAMCREYVSQGDFLQYFRLEKEIFRPQVTYDYTRPPHAGPLNYEVWQWSMTGAEVCAEFKNFMRYRASMVDRRATGSRLM